MRQLLFTILIFSITIPGIAQNQRLLPRNEYKNDSSLSSFVDKLKVAIKSKDKQFIISVLDKNIRNSFGGDDGIEEFKQMWKFNSSNSDLWKTMERIINYGGVFITRKESRHQFVFPYIFELELKNSDDYFSVMVVTVGKLKVKEKPDLNSRTVGELSYDVVWIEYSDEFKPKFEVEGWTYIRTLDKKIIGYVPSEYLYSPIGYRMFLSKIDNKWIITTLVAGD
jgi:hypothetical protein